MKLTSPEYRILMGTVGWLTVIFMAVYGQLFNTQPDATALTTIGSASTVLLGVGIVKKHKNFEDV